MRRKYYRQESRRFGNELDMCVHDPPEGNETAAESIPEITFTEDDKERMLRNILAKIHSIQAEQIRNAGANKY
jgi:hypothetical protein